MTPPDDDLDRRLRDHYRSLSTPAPNDAIDGARTRLADRRPPRAPFVLAAAAIGAIALVAVVAVIGAPPPDDLAPTRPSAAPAATPAGSPTPAESAAVATRYEAGQVLRVTGDALGDPIEAYRGDYMFVVQVAADAGPAFYHLQGPPQNGLEDASRVAVPVDLLEANVEPAQVDCPAPPTSLSEVEVLEPFRRLVCFDAVALTLQNVWVEAPVTGHADLRREPDGRLARFPEPGAGTLPFSVAEGVTLPGPGWVTVAGQFGLADAACGDPQGVLTCRERFLVDAVQPGRSPFATLAGSWTRMADAPIPGRSSYVAIPIDRGTFIWGGDAGEDATTGAIYDDVVDRWTPVARAPGPDRIVVAAAWTGTDVLIWGGNDGLADGLAYDPALDRWTAIPDAPIDGGFGYGTWTGTEFVVVSSSAEAAAWDPRASAWRRLPDPPVPPGHMETAWTGGEFIVLGIGQGGNERVVGAAFDPSSSTWRPMAEVPYDGLILGDRALWTGDELLFVGHAYDPATDSWRILKREGCGFGAVSDGVWSGRWVIGQVQAYDPQAGRCLTLPEAPVRPGFDDAGFDLRTHEFHTPVWADGRLVVWSGGTGLDGPGSPPDGVVFTPAEP
jgi:hypothetical protein